MADSLNSVLKKMQKKYGDSVVKRGADSLEVDGMLSLGSPMVDYMLYGGLPEGRIIELSGAEGSGKTTTSFLIAASYQKAELERHPVGMEWEDNTRQLHEGPRGIIFLDNEGTLDPVWASVFGYDLSEYAKVPTYVIRPEGQNAEQIFDMALDLLKTGEIGLMIFDSIATLVPAQIAEESQEKYQMGGIAKSLTRFANTALGLLRKYKATLVAINQIRDNMSGYGQPITTPGGRSWKHACSSRLMFKKGAFFDENGDALKSTAENPVGHTVEVALLKSKTARSDRRAGSYRLNYMRGVDVIMDTVECALHFGMIDNSVQGSYKIINLETGEIRLDENGDEVKIRGKKNVRTYFEEHPVEFRRLYEDVYEKIKEKESPFIDAFRAMLNDKANDVFGEEVLSAGEDEI